MLHEDGDRAVDEVLHDNDIQIFWSFATKFDGITQILQFNIEGGDVFARLLGDVKKLKIGGEIALKRGLQAELALNDAKEDLKTGGFKTNSMFNFW